MIFNVSYGMHILVIIDQTSSCMLALHDFYNNYLHRLTSAKLLKTKVGILSSSLCLVLVPCYVLKTMLFTYSSPSLSSAVCVRLFLYITSL